MACLFAGDAEVRRVLASDAPRIERLRLAADICRFDTLAAVQRAGSGHLGTSFSAMEIFTYLYLDALDVAMRGPAHPDRDVFFSSKGHDCPAQYVVMAAAGLIPFVQVLRLRRLGGLEGHPDVETPGIEAHTGSLGMGVSKAKGIAIAKRLAGRRGRVVVLTGDGELQEGQVWEALQTAVQQRVTNLIVLVDHNKLQSDRWVVDIVDLGDLERKFECFGWHVSRVDGHDIAALDEVFRALGGVTDRPKVVICDTVKGKGVSFMEGPTAMADAGGHYRYHSGALTDDDYARASAEIAARMQETARRIGLAPIAVQPCDPVPAAPSVSATAPERLVPAYADELLALGHERPDIVVLDADLADDCGLRPFAGAFPDRFIEHGIAEQDMVSTAGGLALQRFLPIVHSFGAFLCARANEQIYINSLEHTRIVYVAHLSGLIPATPGQSHQSLRDISLLGSLTNMVIVEPCNARETRALLRWCVNDARESCLLRLVMAPLSRPIALPDDSTLVPGRGAVIHDGGDAIVIGYGPTMVGQALDAADIAERDGVDLKVVNMPWLNRVDAEWLRMTVGGFERIFVIDDHQAVGGLGDTILNAINRDATLRGREVVKLAVEGHAACGTAAEVLAHHALDGAAIARAVAMDKVR